MLRYKYRNKEDIPEKYLDLYTESNGEWVLTGVEGIKTQEDVEKVQEATRKEREDHKKTKEKLAKFGDLDPDETYKKLDRFDELEEAAKGKLDDDQINEMVEKRMRGRVAPLEREIDTLKKENDDLTGQVGEFQEKDQKRTIHDALRKVGTQEKVIDTAIDDMLMFGERVFEIDEVTGKPVTKDGVGVTPGLSPEAWLTEIKQQRPHWWPESRGANANPGAGGGGGNNPFSAEHWNMTEQGRLHLEDPDKAKQMAEIAGTTVGGMKPAPKS